MRREGGMQVRDPNLAVHLSHFGINMREMTKTEKTTAELELDLNEQRNYRSILEADVSLKEVYGPGSASLLSLALTGGRGRR